MRATDSNTLVLTRTAIVAGAVAALSIGVAAWRISDDEAVRRRGHDHRSAVAVTEATAAAVGALLAMGDLSGARRLVLDAGRTLDASRCSLILPDGGTLADMVPSRIDRHELPSAWPSGTGATPSTDAGAARIATAVAIDRDRGAELVVELSPSSSDAAGGRVAAFAAVAGGAVVGAVAALLMRRRMRGLAAVGGAVVDAAEGEPHLEALIVDPRLGGPSEAWNRLLPRLLAGAPARRSDDASIGAEGSEQDGRGVCDTLWHGVLVVDGRRRVRYLNAAASLLLGRTREDAIGSDAAALIGPGAVLEALDRIVAGDANARATSERGFGADATAAGEREDVLRLSVRSLQRSAGPALAFVLVEDVTQQRLADRSRNAFVSQATHELRTPLTNIRLAVEELIEGDDADPAARGHALELIDHETGRLDRMVSDMLSIAEMEAGTLRLRQDDVRIDAMLAALERDFRAQAAAKRIEFAVTAPPKLPSLLGDRDRIQMVLANLLGNAIKYTPEGGAVTLALRDAPGEIAFDVTDTGIGIPEEEHELVFRSFYRAKDRRVEDIVGTGLGLPIAREIARLHGGDVTLVSAANSGSTFTLRLPARTPLALAA